MLNGDESARYWGNVNLSFAYVEGESLLMGLKVTLVNIFTFHSDLAYVVSLCEGRVAPHGPQGGPGLSSLLSNLSLYML